MKIIVTIGELMDLGLWLEYCEITGAFEYAVNEGLRDRTDEVGLPDSMVNTYLSRIK